MLFRDDPGGTIAISQPGHAWISGQIIRAWGNAEFGPVAPREDVCLGAEQHDIGWLTWERSPTLNLATGRPHSFRELPVAAHTELWRVGAEMALAFGRYPALLVSLHGTGLYAAFSGSAADGAIVREFLSGQSELQRRLIESLRADRGLSAFAGAGMIERNRGLVRTADRMSIAICTGMRDMAIRSDNPGEGLIKRVPTADGETDIRMRAVDGNLATIAVAPWPFAVPTVPVSCEGIALPAYRFDDEQTMRAALGHAERVVVAAELRPG